MSGDKVNYIVCRKRRKGGDTEAEIVENYRTCSSNFCRDVRCEIPICISFDRKPFFRE